MTDGTRPQMTAHGLCGAIEDFIRDNGHSRDVMLRWVANHLEATLMLCRRVRADNLHDGDKHSVGAFRLGEINKEREIEVLDKEAKKLTGNP